jgi:hypothetical protein
VLEFPHHKSGIPGIFNRKQRILRGFSAPAVGRKMNPSTESPHLCVICGEPCSLEECLTDEKGRIVHKECYQTLLLRALNFDKLPGISTTRQKPFNIDQPSTVHYGKLLFMKKEPSPKWILAVRCPTCGAAPGEKCELSTGQPTEPHRERPSVPISLRHFQ